MADDFDRIVEGAPDLAGLDDGFTVQISGPTGSVSVTRVDFERWVRELAEYARRDPANWLHGVAGFAEQPRIVVFTVVREVYLALAEVVFSQVSVVDVPALQKVMFKMAMFCRGELALMGVDEDE